MASVEKRVRNGNVAWRAHWRDPSGKQRNRSFDRKVDAQAFLTSVEQSKLVGSYIDPGRANTTVGALADQWLAGKVGLKPTTRALYESVIHVHVRPRWGTTPLAKVTHGDVQAWVADLASRLSPGHTRKVFGVLSGILALSVRDRRIPSSPADGIELPRVRERRRKYLTASQVEQLAIAAAALPSGRPRRSTDSAFAQYRLVVLVLAYCGLRWSEVAGLKVGRIDLTKRRLQVAEAVTEVDGARLVWGTPKTHEARSVPIPAFVLDDLARHMAGKSAGELVFTAPDGGVMRNRNARRAWFDRAAAQIGVPDLTPHELRHTAASLAVSAGANVKAVQRMLGHASAVMTLDRYADLFDDDLDAVATRLNAVREAAVAQALPSRSVTSIGDAPRKSAAQ